MKIKIKYGSSLKNLCLALVAISLFISCSGKDDDEDNSFNSQIFIDGVLFAPTSAADLTTSFVVTDNGTTNHRNFSIKKVGQATNDRITVAITLPINQSINGTFGFTDNTQDFILEAFFTKGNDAIFQFGSGTLKFTDLGHDRFRIDFNNVVANGVLTSAENKTITGFIEGKFKDTGNG
ncbi:hypothetical protein [Flavobacterium sp. 3HN19-14]|uniref:hypothetical protein n=1 Tax=Flavobacterium sp. 3HN19-14 TaxID=3448133 RepID=UPI003EE24F53